MQTTQREKRTDARSERIVFANPLAYRNTIQEKRGVRFRTSKSHNRTLPRPAGTFGIAALLVAALGIFGVVAGIVTARLNEIGIRMALGATSASVLKMILHQGLTPVVVGLIAVLAAAVACGSVLRALLFEASPPIQLPSAVLLA